MTGPDRTRVRNAPLALDGYTPLAGTVDEMLQADGTVRAHWQPLLDGLGGLGADVRQRRWESARRLIRENGITYNIYGDPEGLHRPWELDFLPLVIQPQEWASIEAGLKQRARLLNLIARDIYGPQRLIKDGLLPPHLVLGNPNFLRPLWGAEVPGGTYVHFYAADLGRGPDGRWWVLSDRTQAPSGAGYALENRIILARALPELFEACNVERLAQFFATWRAALISLVQRDDAHAVLLTPGPYNETYFEHVYLARYLGVTLVEGGDLTVRDDQLFLKTLDGLQRVDLVLRRVDSDFCDPLELRSDSALGVPGLVRAVRAGNVVVANALGSGVLECDGLNAFLPALSRQLLGEDLAMPNVATWWCGDEGARNHVLANMNDLAIRETFETRSVLAPAAPGQRGAAFDPATRARVLETMEHRSYSLVGQELVTLSSAPVLEGGERLDARPVALRCFVAAVGDDFIVMPGGLTRFSATRDPHAITMQSGDGSKDTWVISEGEVSSFSLLPQTERAAPTRRAAADLPSRAADNLFWLGRYIERMDATLRLVRSTITRLVEPEAAPGGIGAVARLGVLLTHRIQQDEDDEDADAVEAREPRDLVVPLNVLLADGAQPNGIAQTIGNVQRTAFLVRDRLSMDAFRMIGELGPGIMPVSPALAFDTAPALAIVNRSLTVASALAGLQAENMTRGSGWLFMDMGKRLERARNMIELIRLLMLEGDPESNGGLALLLELADSFMTYRTRYLAAPQVAPVLDLLLLDETNPRSIAFQIQALVTAGSRIPRPARGSELDEDERVLTALGAEVRLLHLDELCEKQADGSRGNLDEFLSRLDAQLLSLSDMIGRIYFAHVASQRTSFAPRG